MAALNGKKEVKTHGNIADTAPLLKALKLLQAHKGAELVERTHTPVAGLLDTHDFDRLEDSGDTARAKAARDGARRFMQDLRELIGLERAVWLSFQSVSDGGGSEPKERTREREKRHVPSKGPATRISAVPIDHFRARNPEIALGPLVIGVCFGWLIVREVCLECCFEPLFIVV